MACGNGENASGFPVSGQVGNPFTYRGKITNPGHVFGRGVEARRAVRGSSLGGSVLLTGPPRIGKSSLLALIHHRLTTGIQGLDRPVARPAVRFVDIDRLADDQALISAVAAPYGMAVSSPGELLQCVSNSVGELDLYLCIDEYQEILEPRFSNYLARFLRSLSQEPGFNMIVSVDQYKLLALRDDPRLPYCLNVFDSISVSVLEREHVVNLVETMLQRRPVTFSGEQINEICDITGCHPFKVQVACFHLYNELQVRGAGPWRELYETQVRECLETHQPPDILDEVIRALELSLRKAFGAHRPTVEKEVCDQMEVILRAAGFAVEREGPQFEFAVRGFRPDFSLGEKGLAIEVKLCDSEAKLKRIVEQMGADVTAYGKKFPQRLFVVYDANGSIADVPRLVNDFEKIPGVKVHVCKH